MLANTADLKSAADVVLTTYPGLIRSSRPPQRPLSDACGR